MPLSENAVNVPAFLSKLWRMVNDPSTDHLICWSPAGNSFIIQNQAQFWYDLLPLYYKHNNMSSFVRQLNMYGFHKMTTVENGTMDTEKDEIQFYHPCFQQDKPEKLREIKRKVTGSKTIITEGINQNNIKTDVSKVLADVKQLRSHQQTVDSQLSAIKQENAVLWRELAMLRQKHMKQQQIVNKLIQFLVTIVQPSNRMNGLGVKRRYPLMINNSPHKKTKIKNSRSQSAGPTIHELDSEVLSDDLFEVNEETQLKVESPASSDQPQKTPPDNLFDDVNIGSVGSNDIFLSSPELIKDDSPEFITVDELFDSSAEEIADEPAEITNLQQVVSDDIEEKTEASNKVFLNPSSQDTLLSNLINGNYNTVVTNAVKRQDKSKILGKKSKLKNDAVVDVSTADNNENSGLESDMTVATRDNSINDDYRNFSIEELDEHLHSTQSELDQLKEVLSGSGTFDANTLLGLFNDSSPYSLPYGKNKDVVNEPVDANNELMSYAPDILDFNELFDDVIEVQDTTQNEWPSSNSKDVVLSNVQCVKRESNVSSN